MIDELKEYFKKESLSFVTVDSVTDFIEKFLVPASATDDPHLPVNNAKQMGAAWAALHSNYRGHSYSGPKKEQAKQRLRSMYKAKGMETPSESGVEFAGGVFLEESLAKDDSFNATIEKVSCAINARIKAGIDMDCDDDGPQDAIEGRYAYVMDVFPTMVVYSMEGCLYAVEYSIDADGDCHIVGEPHAVEVSYTPKTTPSLEEESFAESYPMAESAQTADNVYPITVIKPGLSKNNRFYSKELLARHASMFEGAKMFSDHATDREMKERPEGRVRDWVANLKDVTVESDGSLRGNAVVIDPAFNQKLQTLKTSGLLNQMGISIRAAGSYDESESSGSKQRTVKEFTAVRSVDFVTFAGAGGQVN